MCGDFTMKSSQQINCDIIGTTSMKKTTFFPKVGLVKLLSDMTGKQVHKYKKNILVFFCSLVS